MSALNSLKGRGLDLSKLNKLSASTKGIPAGQEVLRVHHSECYSTKQVRVTFSAIEALADSMKSRQLQPCKVWPKDDKGYRICIGERRWRAATHGDLYLDIIVDPLLVDLTPAEVILYQLTENTQRENLTPKEEAQAVADMFAEGMSARDIAMAKSAIEQWSESSAASWVSRMRKMLTMPATVEALHDSGLHDIETLNCLTAIHELDPAVCEQLIEDGLTSRKATRAALKALKGGNVVPGSSRSAPVAAQTWGPAELPPSTYSVEVDRHTDGRHVAVVFIKLAGKELKASWLSDSSLAADYVEDVKARVFILVRDFMLSLQCSEPAEQAAYQSIIDYWQITPGQAVPPPAAPASTEHKEDAPTKQPPAAPASTEHKEDAPTKQPPAAPASTEHKDNAPTKQPPAAPASTEHKDNAPAEPAPRNVAGATGLVIHGFLDEDPVVLCLDEVAEGDMVVIQDMDGNRLTVPLDEFTFGSITKA
ncbi:hypothetical protein KAM448_35270 [Aeromonas caviae]|uniref:ParB/Sulfiredoxin domain-containing protein n=1 Tax=Aeromonas caviae TaxID=648 RepID=A0ABD0B900_AERCA|nr:MULTISPECIES: ParB/RepB/Spo0J family partition protein [Aeromonas]BCK65789.1 hypothetical protein KAM330_47780 [Aeromonas hydrophila]BCR31381.1 hypothetical protein KAM376_43870 [Aeromonas caviae]GJA71850.1 hypothetical protein KAM353_14970 [Aeromonas caviae]GJA81677.1 hypothetical protein KAM355_22370 [Aeromonas caviae]GJB11455.1 hypothetical protein KAM362_20150 [Aeromonas caviae]